MTSCNRKTIRIWSASKRLRQVKQAMAKQFSLFLVVLLAVFVASINRAKAQEAETKIRVEVNMVQLNVAVMDSKGNYVTGLKPSDFEVTEDGIQQKVAFGFRCLRVTLLDHDHESRENHRPQNSCCKPNSSSYRRAILFFFYISGSSSLHCL